VIDTTVAKKAIVKRPVSSRASRRDLAKLQLDMTLRSRRRSRRSLVVPVALIVLICVGIGIGILVIANKSSTHPPEIQIVEQKATPPAPKQEKRDSPKQPDKPSIPVPKNHPEIISKKFEDEWEDAISRGKKLDELEPSETQFSLSKIPSSRRFAIESKLGEVEKAPGLFFIPVILNELGINKSDFTPWLAKMGRFVALRDSDFKEVAKALWLHNPNRENGLLSIMNVWGVYSPEMRPLIAAAIKDKTPYSKLPSSVRTEIIALAGEDWFSQNR
jgi:hypothetical protein